MYAAAERISPSNSVEHVLVAVDAGSGALLRTRNIDPPGMAQTNAQQERGGLVLSQGNVYVPFGGLLGDCATYNGWVVGTSEDFGSALYAWHTGSAPGARGGIWEPAGVQADSAGFVYAATGNGAASAGSNDGGNAVFKLSPTFSPVDSFIDPSWAADSAADSDFGSAGTVLLGDGNLFVLGKQRTGYVVNTFNMAAGSLASGTVCFSIGGDAYAAPFIYVPCNDGMRALRYSSPAFSVAWQGPSDANGPPIVAGGYVWVTAYSNGKLYALDPGTGRVVQQFATPPQEHFTTPSAGGGRVFVAAGSNVLAYAGSNAFVPGPPPTQGYWTVASDGGVFSYGRSQFHGSKGGQPLNAPVVGMAATPDGGGYWLVASDGGVFTFGNARFLGSKGGQRLNAPVVGIAATPDGGGYSLAASDGGVFTFGDARFFGSRGGQPLNAPVVGIAATPASDGYRLVARDGGVFDFGAARFYGSKGGQPLNAPVVGIAGGTGGGYWLDASDGGVFTFGPGAAFMGSKGGQPLNAPAVGMAPTGDGGGYRLVARDGGIFDFGDAAFYGSKGGQPLNAPMVGMAANG